MAQVTATFTANISGYVAAMSQMNSSTRSMQSGISGLSGRVSQGMSTIGKVTTAAGAATTAMGVSALKSYGTFQQSLNKAAIIAGGTSKDIGELADMANKMGAELPLSAQDAADAMVSMAQDGASIKTITKEFPAIAEAATATGADLQTTAGTVQQAMNIWGDSLKSPARAAAILTQTANLSNASVEDMSGAIANIGGVAKTAGFGMGDMSEAIGLMTNKGFTAQRASQDLAHAIIQMEAPSDKAAGVMKKLGLTFTDAQGNMKPFPQILNEVAKATDGMSSSQQTAALKTLFNAAGMQAISPLLDSIKDKSDNTATSWSAYASAQDKASSSAAASHKFLSGQASEMQKNIGSSIEQVTGNWESLRNKSMEAAKKINGSMIGMINQALTWSNSSNSSTAKIVRGFIGLSPAIGVAMTSFGSFLTLSNTMSTFATNFTKNMSMIGHALVNPWTIGAAATAIFVVALIKVYQQSSSFRNAIDGIGKSFKSVFNAGWFKQTVGTIGQIFNNLVSIATNAVTGLAGSMNGISWTTIFGAIRSGIDIALNALQSLTSWVNSNSDWLLPLAKGIATFVVAVKTIKVVTSVIGWIQQTITIISMMARGVGVLKGAWTGLTALLGIGPWGIVIAAVAAVVVALTAFFTQTKVGRQMWSSFTSWLSSLWSGIVSTAQGIWNGLSSFFSGLWSSITTGATTAWTSFTSMLSGLWSGITDTASSIWSGLSAFFTTLWTGITTVASTIWTGLVTTVTTIWTGIVTTATTIFTPIATFFTTLWTGIWTAFTTAWTGISTSAMTAWNGLVTLATGVFNLLKAAIMAPILILADLIDGQWNMISSDLSLVWNSIVSAGSSIWNGFVGILSGIWGVISGGAIGWWNAIGSALKTIWNGIKAVASAVWTGIQVVVTTTATAAVNVVKALWNGGKAVISGIWNGLKSLALTVWNGIRSGISAAVSGTISGAISLWNGFRSFMSGLWNGIRSAAIGAWNGIRSSVISIAMGVINGVRGAWSGFTSIASNVANGIISAFNALRNFSLADAGRAIMDSFFSGLQAAWGKVQSFVGGIASWIRQHKGPVSYDAKLLIPAGNAIMTGLNKGLVNSFGDVQKNVTSMASDLLDNINNVANQIDAGNVDMQAASYSSGDMDQNIDTDNWVQPTYVVHNEIIGDKIRTIVSQGDADARVHNKFFIN
ncbi:phage tail tape measure protein [Lactiplantibacillus plantarum]|uniref:phage tail tape measure protein n=1 Tax=Lactiplantibacillus plantarum TaxID=1590 RepID=UPI002552087D|nr:phage tail tape measure protein [Lactiplantibacillus plantarum]WIR71640.1 phage tail tape measure protein [Lactiplantibacillus plantarum]